MCLGHLQVITENFEVMAHSKKHSAVKPAFENPRHLQRFAYIYIYVCVYIYVYMYVYRWRLVVTAGVLHFL